jgi:NO-binding membrane sensor protein with MHYT domain/CheY-like chemotaxis protein
MSHYNYWLVLVSIVVATLASFTALSLTARISAARGSWAHLWLAGGACAMGVGIWSMHFIGMLAFNPPIPLGYDLAKTLLSLLIAIVASVFALRVASRRSLSWRALGLASVVMGGAIVSMHYVGMAAVVLNPPMQHGRPYVLAAVLVAIAASLGALSLAFKLKRAATPGGPKVLAALLMGAAIAGMHYTAMAGVHIAPDAVSLSGAVTDEFWLAGSVTAASVVILGVALVLSLMDSHMSARTRQMSVSLERAQESNKAKDEFLAVLGHELRNPLAAISNAVALLDNAERRGASDQFALGVMHRQVTHLRRLIDDLVDVGRVTAGKIHLHFELLDLHAAACNAVAALRGSGQAAQYTIDCGGKPVWMSGDGTRIEQIVTNLLTNALRYSPAGSSIAVTVERQRDSAILVVRDMGIGISPEELPRVFDLFYQADRRGVHRGSAGLGIGLTLVRRLVQLHGGTVTIESGGVGTGTTVTVSFPAIEAAEADVSTSGVAGTERRRTVVVVDDERDIRESLRMLLVARGHTVLTAEDGISGLHCILEEGPDVALVDIGMPGMDGYEVARQLRAKGSVVYLVAVTGFGQLDDKARAYEAGFNAHITKPISTEQLSEFVASAA